MHGNLLTNRRFANELFIACVENVEYHSGSTYESLIACEAYVRKAEDDEDTLIRVVIDRTATRTLGDLSDTIATGICC